ncbi:glycosyltransferase [Agreia pratensis]|uniref:Glycosyltransferase involved in cell wall bisynthesis n=1 Tax=Agreia pratensis TaxID=150121 RepID=A0A1X7IM95_9MICO|nr:glycosyltransferase [Agreia pratensis]SMG16089.1 Glycosyltransferase involved in cell wall bisynthesis [Agreia pratensis]
MSQPQTASPRGATDVRFLRVLPELRASQVEDYRNAGRDGDVIYFSRHYDLGLSDIPPTFHSVTLGQAVRQVLRSEADTFELPEPFWARYAVHTVILALIWRINGLRRGRSRRARLYAIENNDPIMALLGRPVPAALRAVLAAGLGLFILLSYERIAFGSDGAKNAYESLPLVSSIPSGTFLELPTGATDLPTRSSPGSKAIFIGNLESRKGLSTLLEAWPQVENDHPASHLTIVGAGALEQRVARWAAEKAQSRSFLGRVEHSQIDPLLDQADVVIVPSERDGRWREQIGLPIVEGLSRGLTVVTTDETGLAPWLRSTGHVVVASPCSPAELAEGILSALECPLPQHDVVASLPREEARIQAARWLLEP